MIKQLRFPLLILVIGGSIFALLLWMGKSPPKTETVYQGPLVKAVHIPQETTRIVVDGQGTVRPGAQIDVVPQVMGTVAWKAKNLEPGGYFQKGDVLFRIEQADYQLAVKQTEAQVAQAKYQLDLMQQEADLARQEWEELQKTKTLKTPEPNALVFQLPQLRATQAAYDAAQAQMEEAQLHLKRTEVRAPFNGRVGNIFLDVGQFVSPGKSVGLFYSIESAEIVIPVPNEDLAWFDLGILKTQEENTFPEATVIGHFAGKQHTWQGQLTRTEATLDPQSRLAHLIVEVPDPYQINNPEYQPLMAGLYVTVHIQGKTLSGVRRLPRVALRENNEVWAVGPDQILRVRKANILRDQQDGLLTYIDLAENEKVIVSQISGITDGMRVRVAEGESP